MIEEVKTFNIKGVHVFSTGKWNEDNYDVNDLQAMVQAYMDMRGGWRPYLKLGHDRNQKFAKSQGLPALGWVSNLYVRGDKLYADFENIPEKLFRCIQSKAYRKVSCEVLWDVKVGDQEYRRVLSAVALLGAEQPGVMNLDDILGTYSYEDLPLPEQFAFLRNPDNINLYSTTFEYEPTEDQNMPTAEELQAQLEEQSKKYASLEQEKKELEEKKAEEAKEIESLREYKASAEAKALKDAEELKAAKLSEYCTQLEAKKLLTTATRPLVEQILGDKKEYSVDGKAASKEEILEKILTLTSEAAKVNLDERSQADYAKKDQQDKDDEMDKTVQSYMKENKCSYAMAYKAVAKMSKK
jgi:hypothetical protein